MMETLRNQADRGRTVVLVTHATANIHQCDHVCFLAQGRMVYFGPPAEAFDFFQIQNSTDFADIYDQLDDPDPEQARQKAIDWERRFKASDQYRRYVIQRQRALPQVQQRARQVPSRQRPRVNSLRQFFILAQRYLNLVRRDRLLLTVLLAIMPFIGTLLLVISSPQWLVGDSPAEIEHMLADELAAGEQSATYAIVGNSQRLLFMMALAAVLLGLFAAAYEIVKERAIYRRERMVTLRLLPYLASKVTVLSIFALIQCLLLLAVVAIKVELPSEGVFLPAPLEMYITLVVGTLAAIMLGLLISALMPNTDTIIYAVLLVLFVQIIFAGVIFKLPGVAQGLSTFTLSRWTMEGLGTSADMEKLAGLSTTHFQPDPITRTVEFEAPVIASDWEPVTVVTETQTLPVTCPGDVVLEVPVSAPRVTVHEVVTTTETFTETRSFTPELQRIPGKHEFQIDFGRTVGHLWRDWLLLLGFAVAFGIGTVLVLKGQDIR